MTSRIRASRLALLGAAFVAVGCHAVCGAEPAPSAKSDAALRAARCVGPVNAKRHAVYLHGIDAPTLSDQELGNRQALEELASALDMRIALPRASQTCGSGGAVCWGWAMTQAEIETTAGAVSEAAEACFGKAPFGIIAFSNGGYAATAMFRRCELQSRLPAARWLVTVGAAMMRGSLEPEPASLAGCGRLVMLVGTRDLFNADPADNYEHRLRAKGADVRSVRYEGGHAVLAEPLGALLTGLSP